MSKTHIVGSNIKIPQQFPGYFSYEEDDQEKKLYVFWENGNMISWVDDKQKIIQYSPLELLNKTNQTVYSPTLEVHITIPQKFPDWVNYIDKDDNEKSLWSFWNDGNLVTWDHGSREIIECDIEMKSLYKPKKTSKEWDDGNYYAKEVTEETLTKEFYQTGEIKSETQNKTTTREFGIKNPNGDIKFPLKSFNNLLL